MRGTEPHGTAAAVVALWGVTSGDAGALAANSVLALRAMVMGRDCGALRVLQFSSAGVYIPGPDDLDEASATGARSPYGLSKLAMEAAVAREPGPEACCLRVANVVGADSLFAALDSGGTVTLDRFADGSGPKRSYIGIAELARVIEALLAHDLALPPVLNVAGQPATDMADIVRAAGFEPLWRPAPEGAAARVALDTRRLHRFVPLPDRDASALVADWRAWRDPS
jgi:nucleoside-diphosphate-sugar epimerase